MKSYNIFLKDADVVIIENATASVDGFLVKFARDGSFIAVFNLNNIMGVYEA